MCKWDANRGGSLARSHSLGIRSLHSFRIVWGWRIGNFPHTHTAGRKAALAAPKPNHKNALIRGKRGAKNYTHTHAYIYVQPYPYIGEARAISPSNWLGQSQNLFTNRAAKATERKHTVGEKEKCSRELSLSLSAVVSLSLARHSFYFFSSENHVLCSLKYRALSSLRSVFPKRRSCGGEKTKEYPYPPTWVGLGKRVFLAIDVLVNMVNKF